MAPLRRRFYNRILIILSSLAVCHGDMPRTHGQEQARCFVKRDGTAFYLNGCPYRLTGTNQYYQMIHRRGGDRPRVNEVLDEMAARGMTVLRTWAFQDDAGRSDCLQCAPARQLAPHERPANFMNETTFRGLDELLVQASSRGIRVILTLVNNWDDFAGMRRYSLWRFGPQGVNHDAFYNDPVIRAWFKEYISLLVNRVNYVNGRRYRDDPTILAWELANEARCLDALDSPCRTGAWIDSWILEMSCYIKSIDPNHLVTTGSEGFYGPNRADGNTDSWMTNEGTDFVDNHSGPCIDFATIHVWPRNWGWDPLAQTDAALARVQEYTLRRLADGLNILGKPVVIEEFGLPRDDSSRCPDSGALGPTSIRDRFYRLFYSLCEGAASPDGSCAGALNWMVYDAVSCAYDDENGVFFPDDSSTDDVMTEHAHRFGTCSGTPGSSESTCPGDMDFECDVDLADFPLFPGCLSGPDLDADMPECIGVDIVRDGRVDLKDIAQFQIRFSGGCP